MEATFNIDISDYMSTSEIAEMVRDEVRWQIRDKVEKSLKYVGVGDIIYSAASKAAMQLLEEQDIDIYQKMATKVLECIDDLSKWQVFNDSKDHGKTKGQIEIVYYLPYGCKLIIKLQNKGFPEFLCRNTAAYRKIIRDFVACCKKGFFHKSI